MTYLLTFACYGSHLPGEEGSIDRYRNLPGSRLTPPNPALLQATQMAMRQVPYEMHAATRHLVLQVVREVCDHKSWRLLAAHVRTNHVHIVMEGEAHRTRRRPHLCQNKLPPRSVVRVYWRS